MHSDDDDGFGLSSGDEAALLAAVSDEPRRPPMPEKRKFVPQDDETERPTKRRYPTTSPLAVDILNRHFGLRGFRLEQEAVISRILGGGSAVVVFPTGGGKSLCYQVPALAFSELDKQSGARGPAEGGVTIVVSPLIALMKDQVDALRSRNLSAAVLDSTKTREEYLEINDQLRAGSLKLLYCAPERLNNEGFVESIKNVRGGVRLVAVDEAHCISEWGHAFRPDYLKVARFVSEIKAERVVCLTATATQKVAQDICDAFDIDESGLFRTTVYRPNLRLLAEHTKTKQEKYPKMFRFLREHPGPSIIYVTVQKQSEQLAMDLLDQGFHARAFHAGMQTADKIRIQDEFMRKDNIIICATIAFGMGIDKANIRNVIHFDIPRSIEGYSQQVGRAGRDGLLSICIFYLCPEDLHLQDHFNYGDLPSKESVRRFLKEVCSAENMQLKIGETFTTSHYAQSKAFDIRTNALGILYAQLELQFGLIRAVTPQYSSYQYESIPLYVARIMADRSRAAMAIRDHATKAVKYYHVDVLAASRGNGLVRADVVRKLNEWNESGWIDLKTSGIQHVYRVSRALPSTHEELEEITGKLYAQMEERERQDIKRTEAIVKLVTSKACFSRSLAAYFENKFQDIGQECGHCTWCETHKPVVLGEIPSVPMDRAAVGAILRACPARDDPRFLARIAFGIPSPRVSEMKLAKDPVFGSMANQEFMALVRVFTAACENAPASASSHAHQPVKPKAAPARKAPARKTPARKTPAWKAPARKAPAKKAPASKKVR